MSLADLYPGLDMGKATRDAYGQALRELGDAHEDIVVLDADLAKSTRSWKFGERFPDRFLNVGIEEANMVGMAGGLAASGKVPFISSFACFVILKGFDQLRMAVAYPGANVKIAGSHGGVSVGADGVSQQATEDIALACALPGMVVCVPSDENQALAAVRAAYRHQGPVYMRTGRAPAPRIYEREPEDFGFGRGARLREGEHAAVIANGMLVGAALVAHERLAAEGIRVRVVDMHTVKPIDVEEVESAARETGAIVAAEEHLYAGGLGASVAQAMGRTHPVPMEFVCLGDRYAESGPAEDLLVKYGLTADDIVAAVRRVIARRDAVAASA
ncbi:MAG: transketolase C-terminal domain-containing protein [Gemmatimonadota bacterium]